MLLVDAVGRARLTGRFPQEQITLIVAEVILMLVRTNFIGKTEMHLENIEKFKSEMKGFPMPVMPF